MASFVPDVSLGEDTLITIGGNSEDGIKLLVQTGTVRESTQEVNLGCALSGGFTFRTGSFRDLSIDAKCQWTVVQNPFANPPMLIPGQETSDVFVYPNFADSPDVFYQLPTAYVAAATCEMESGGSGGVVSYNLSLKNQEDFGTPASPIS